MPVPKKPLDRLYAGAGPALAGLGWRIFLTRVGMLAESASAALWPAAAALMAGYAAASFGTGAAPAFEFAAWIAWGLTSGFLLLRGLFRTRWPRRGEALARMDRSLPGSPIAALLDRRAPAGGRAGDKLWDEHVRRMVLEASKARAAAPAIRLAESDPYCLRLAGAVAFAVALLFGPGIALPTGVPHLGAASADATGTTFDAWMEPPAHTGMRSIYLNEVASGATLEAPEGSVVTVLEHGGSGELKIAESVSGGAGPESGDGGRRTLTIIESGELRLAVDGGTEAFWRFEAMRDRPPAVAPRGPMVNEPGGVLEIPLRISDDYGVASLEIEFQLDSEGIERLHGLAAEHDPAKPQTFPIPLPYGGSRTEIETKFRGGFESHPWAGLPVRIVATATDSAGQPGRSEDWFAVLPEREFLDPVAAALAEQRRDLMWSGANADRVARAARAITHDPDTLFDGIRSYAFARAAIRRLESGPEGASDPSRRSDAASLLWQAALAAEGGNIEALRRRLADAGERLADAIREGASEEMIAGLLQEYRSLMEEYLRQMAQSGAVASVPGGQFAESREIGSDQLEDMLEELERMLREGRMEEAGRMLSELRSIMENLVAGQPEGGSGAGQFARQSVDGFRSILREQQGLADRAYRDLRELGGPESAGRSSGNTGSSGGIGSGRDHFGEGEGSAGAGGDGSALSGLQETLRQRLRSQMRDLANSGALDSAEALGAFEDAARAMTRARDRLADGDLQGGIAEQTGAMERLGEGIRSLGRSLQGADDSGYGGPPGTGTASGDPFGRSGSGRAGIGHGSLVNPEALLNRRVQELREEIRRRTSVPDRPQSERDYLIRLLERY